MLVKPKIKHFKEIAKQVRRFNIDHYANIQLIVEYAGKHLDADAAFYNKQVGDELVTIAGWNVPPDFENKSAIDGHLCNDVINPGSTSCLLINDLTTSRYYETDPAVPKYNLKAYAGASVDVEGVSTGSLCVVYNETHNFSEFEDDVLRLLSVFVGMEEDRLCKDNEVVKTSEFLHTLIEDSLDMIVAIDQNRNIVLFNKAAKYRFGYTEDEILGKHIDTLYASKQNTDIVFNDMRGTGKFRGEVVNIDKHGNSFVSRLSASTLYGRDGEHLGAVGISRDITEQKKITTQLLASERRFREMAEFLPIAIVEFSVDGVVNYSNKAGLDIFEYPLEDIENGKINIIDTIHENDRELALSRLNEMVSTGVLTRGNEYRLIKADQSIVECLAYATPMLDENGRVYGIRSSVTDITAVKSAEKELRNREASLNAIVSTAKDSIVTTDNDGNITFWNNSAEKMFGYTSEEVVNKSIDIIIPEEFKLKHNKSFESAIELSNHQPNVIDNTIELYGIRKNGEKFPLELSLSRWGTNGSSFFTGIVRDITNRKEIENNLKRRDSILQAVSYTADKFLNSNTWYKDIDAILNELGKATDVSRVYMFKNIDIVNSVVSQVYEWCADGIDSGIDTVDLVEFSLKNEGFGRWVDTLANGKIIHGNVGGFPVDERSALQQQGIKSILVMPIIIDDLFWGFIGFDECRVEKTWSEVEVDALRIVTNTLEAGITRDERREQEELENRIQWEEAEKKIKSHVSNYLSEGRESKKNLFKAARLMNKDFS